MLKEWILMESDYWKCVALYLADCHAANYSIAEVKGTAKYQRQRIVTIMRKAQKLLKEECSAPSGYTWLRGLDEVALRLEKNVAALESLYPHVKED